MAFQPTYRILVAISKDQLVGEGQWNATGLVIKEHEPDQANAGAKICNVDRFNHALRHTIPQLVAQEVEKGFVMGMRLDSTPSGYTVVDKS